jgi:hypothetical protein
LIELGLERWSAWLPGVESPEAWRVWAAQPRLPGEPAAPSAAEIPALLRRRCDALSRALLHVAGECCAPALRGEVATVFASRFGPLGAVTANLEALAAGGPLSPTTFSHAVHNTALGLFSIWAHNRQPGSALAAGDQTFAHGWVEASLFAQRDRVRPVLLVAGDAAPPSVLPASDAGPLGPHAVALLLRQDGGERVRLRLEPPDPPAAERLPAPLAFIRWWLSGEPRLRLGGPRRSWIWERA